MNNTRENGRVQGEKKNPPLFTFEGRGQTIAQIIRYWMAHFRGGEFKILMYLYGQQFGYEDKREVWITRHQFEKGFDARDGTPWHEGTGLSKTAIDSALQNLERRRAIFVRREQSRDMVKCWYRFNPEWAHEKANANGGQASQKTGRATPKSETRHPKSWGRKEENEKETTEKNSAEPSASAEFAFGIKITARNRPRLSLETDFKCSHPEEVLSAEQISEIWSEAFRKGFPNVPFTPLKKREAHAIRAHSKRFLKGGYPFTFERLLRWSVENWRMIRSAYFRKMTSAPEYPAALFMVRVSHTFEHAYVDRDRMGKRLRMTSRDAAIARLMDSGMPHEIAEREWKERNGMADRERAVAAREAALTNTAIQMHAIAEQRVALILRARERQNKPAPERVPVKVKDFEEFDLTHLPDQFPPFKER